MVSRARLCVALGRLLELSVSLIGLSSQDEQINDLRHVSAQPRGAQYKGSVAGSDLEQ